MNYRRVLLLVDPEAGARAALDLSGGRLAAHAGRLRALVAFLTHRTSQSP